MPMGTTGPLASFSGGSTGLLPAVPTSGPVSLSGTLNIAHGGTGVTGFGVVTAKTANDTLIASQSYGIFTNAGSAGTVTLSLPTPTAGLEFTFICISAQDFVLNAGGTVQIAIGEIIGTAGGGATCNSPYSTVTIRAVSSTLWVATSSLGSWTPS